MIEIRRRKRTPDVRLCSTFDAYLEEVGNFGAYQVRLFLVTQLAYMCITGSMLCTVYDGLSYEDSRNQQLAGSRCLDSISDAAMRISTMISSIARDYTIGLEPSPYKFNESNTSNKSNNHNLFRSQKIQNCSFPPIAENKVIFYSLFMHISSSIDHDPNLHSDNRMPPLSRPANFNQIHSYLNASSVTSTTNSTLSLALSGAGTPAAVSITRYIPTLLTSAVMTGGMVGSVIFGHVADRWGRRPVCLGALFGVLVANIATAVAGAASGSVLTVVGSLFALGVFGGGYMVTNLVILLENVGARWRLFCVSMNGFPFGMITMALTAYLTRDYFWYHIALAAQAFLCFLCLLCIHESPRWLAQRNRWPEAKRILRKMARTNRRPYRSPQTNNGPNAPYRDEHENIDNLHQNGIAIDVSLDYEPNIKFNAPNFKDTTENNRCSVSARENHFNLDRDTDYAQEFGMENSSNEPTKFTVAEDRLQESVFVGDIDNNQRVNSTHDLTCADNITSEHTSSSIPHTATQETIVDPEAELERYNEGSPHIKPASIFDDVQIASPTKLVQNYGDLVRSWPIRTRLFALCASWLISSIISYGIYFSVGKSLPGDIFANTMAMGIFKGASGQIPLILDRWGVGRKPVFLGGVAVTTSLCCVMVGLHATGSNSIILAVVAVICAALIDPIWKVNHLYSAELFPTSVRNMARAVCNVGSRLGSVIGPQIQFLDTVSTSVPYAIYGVLGGCLFAVGLIYLPETKDRPLPDAIIFTEENEFNSSPRTPLTTNVES